jgi:2'-5' RNA ligase
VAEPASLYVVAWPVLAEADETALVRLRAQYHPGEARLIGPHFTLVFGAALERADALRDLLETTVDGRRPFWFMLERLRHEAVTPTSRAAYLFAGPADGAAELTDLHDALNSGPDARDFDPHITLGLFPNASEAERIARIVERQHLPMRGRVEELALLRRDGERLETLATFELGG